MKRVLPLLAFLFLFFGSKTFASHDLGGEISYQQISPNNYLVTYKHYRNCASTADPVTTILNVKAPNCNAGRNITLNLVGQKTGRPYGPAIPVSCTTTSRQNYQISTYTGMLSFSAAEAACSDWVISWSECCRPSTANLVGQDNLYTEAKLKLTAGVINSSPAFDTLHAPIMYVNFGDIYNLSMAAIDTDGDSLVYSLVAPLSAANTPVTTKPYPQSTGPANYFVNPNPKPPYSNPLNPQLAQLNGGVPPTYSPQFPIPSILINWNAAPTVPIPDPSVPGGIRMIWAATNTFELNAKQGELRFSPSMYDGVHPTTGINNYIVAVMVEEFRKINGVMTKLGDVRRETMIEVMGNVAINPLLASQQANNQVIPSGYEIKLRPGTPLTLNFAGTDPDNNTVVLSTNATYILPGSNFVSTSGINPTGTITWTPTAADVRWQPYFFQVQFRDDANPLRGIRYETYAVRVSNTGGVTSSPEAFQKQHFTAFPNPFSEELNFSLDLTTKAESIVIYNLLGQKVDEIQLKTLGLGEQKVQWPNAGKHAAGTYVARLISADKTAQTLRFTKLQ